jgi:predicted ATPase
VGFNYTRRHAMDYKLTLYNLHQGTDLAALAQDIEDNYGDNFDLDNGDFSAKAEAGVVEVIAKDVAKGDMKILREDIYRDFGDDEDHMLVRCSFAEGDGSWYPVDLDSDD